MWCVDFADYHDELFSLLFIYLHQVTLPRPAALQLNLKNGNRFVLHANKASSIQSFLQSFLNEFKLVSHVN